MKKQSVSHETMNSLCIPRAMTYTTVADVTQVFNQLFEGNFVKNVDERTQTDSHGQTFKMFYIHFFPDMTSLEMEVFKQKMEEDGVVQVMTGRGKWFWKVYLNKSEKKSVAVRKGPRIMTEEDEQLFLQWKQNRNQAAAEEPTSAFSEEELNDLDEAVTKNEFTESEMDELDAEHTATMINAEQKELMEIADEMFAESKKPPSYASILKR
jgi:hypothetical protein